jgi:hypothetical protein
LDDHAWWLTVVVFESSTFRPGSALVVAADFLWHDRDHLAYSVGGRLRDAQGKELWADVEDEEQFAADAASFARRAKEEVLLYRARFQTIGDWATALGDVARSGDFWRMFDAGIACSLAGRADEGREWLERVRAVDDDRDWVVAAKARAQTLAGLADHSAFIEATSEAVERSRTTLKLTQVSRSDLQAEFSAH